MLDAKRAASTVIRKPVLAPPADMPLDGRQIIASAKNPTTVRRFELPDLELFGNWLFKRLIEKRPHITERAFPALVRTWMQSNEYLFVVAGSGAIGLATTIWEPLAAKPIVREVFVYCREDIEDAQPIYFEFQRWAKLQDADEMLVAYDSDVPMQAIRETLQFARARHLQVVTIDNIPKDAPV